jgi:hypothetical protein
MRDDFIDSILNAMKYASPRHSDPDPLEFSYPAIRLGYVVGTDVPVQYKVLDDDNEKVKPMDH